MGCFYPYGSMKDLRTLSLLYWHALLELGCCVAPSFGSGHDLPTCPWRVSIDWKEDTVDEAASTPLNGTGDNIADKT